MKRLTHSSSTSPDDRAGIRATAPTATAVGLGRGVFAVLAAGSAVTVRRSRQDVRA